MAIGNLYVHSCDGQVHAYWTGGAGTGTLEYSLDSGGLSGWTVASSSITGTNNNYAHTLANSTTARWWRYSEGGAPITFADPAYAHSGTFKDADGWSIVPRGVGKVCVFVSTTGSDAAAGYGVATALQTPTVACSGYAGAGDHILFKRGDSFTVTADLRTPSGSSATVMSMFGAYGESTTARPILTGNFNSAIIDCTNNREHTAVLSLEMTFSNHQQYQGCVGFLSGNNTQKDNVLIEDCYVHDCTSGIGVGAYGGSYFTNVVIRRCVTKNIYPWGAVPPTNDHCSGILLYECFEPLMEDCFFINNGFLVSDRTNYPNTVFNHNVYMSEHVSNCTMTNIVSIGNDLQLRCGGTFSRILMVNQPLGFVAGGRIDYGGTLASEDATFQDFIVDGSDNIDGPGSAGWGVNLTDGNNGLSGNTGTLTVKNGVINMSSMDGGTTVSSTIQPVWIDCASGVTTVHHVLDTVVIARATSSSSDYGAIHVEDRPASLRIVDCTIDTVSGRAVLSELDSSLSLTREFGGNTYYSSRSDTNTYNNGFFMDQIGVSGRSVASYASFAGDPCSGKSGSTKSGSAVAFSAIRRTTDYVDHVESTSGSTVADFITGCTTQRRGAWDPAYTAEYAIDWMRQGYGLPALLTSPPDTPTIDSTTSNSSSITVNWTDVSAVAVSGEYRLDGGAAVAMPNITGTFTIHGLSPGTSYGIEIRVNDGSADSAWSAVATQSTEAAGTVSAFPTRIAMVLDIDEDAATW